LIWGFNKNVITTATTGVAALLLNQGRTIHNWAGIGIGDKPVSELINNIKKCKADLRWMKVDILIIDEISLMSPSLFDKLEEIARLIRNNNKPFGGIQLILS
jgi:ATP-dependent DNA helicase PIF1